MEHLHYYQDIAFRLFYFVLFYILVVIAYYSNKILLVICSLLLRVLSIGIIVAIKKNHVIFLAYGQHANGESFRIFGEGDERFKGLVAKSMKKTMSKFQVFDKMLFEFFF